MPTDIVVKESSIEGRGVFARRDFKKGEVVLKWGNSRELTQKQADGLSENEKRYVECFGGRYLLMQPPERFVNHSCDANTFVFGRCDVAKRDIQKGEEITSDYTEINSPYVDMKCNCGSKNCRGFIRT